jgi:HAD superfamily hydrolase (TIGR01509 family)
MPHAPVLLFDVMDTLVVDPIHDAIPRFFGLTLQALIEQKHPTAWVDFEHGAIDPGEYYRRFFADHRAVDGEELERTLGAAYAWVDGMEAVVCDLAQRGIEMHALSNYPEWYQLVDDKLGVSRYVPWTFVSCKTRLRKPDRNAYLHAANALGRLPSDCLFIDDRSANCRAAEEAGMRSIVFSEARLLRAELSARGIL